MAKYSMVMIDPAVDNPRSDITRDMSKGQVTEMDADKLSFDKFHKAVNLNIEEGDFEVRNGIEDFVDIVSGSTEVSNYGMDIFKDGEDSRLVVAKESASVDTKADIVEYNRSTGAVSILEAEIDSQEEYDFTDQNDFLYVANGETDLSIIDPGNATTTVAMPNVGEYAKQVVSDGSSVWATTTDNLLRISDAQTEGKITTFSPTGTDLGRAAIANSDITNFVSLKEAAPYIAAASPNRVEICARPNFEREGVETFPTNFPTVKRAFKGIGTTSKDGMVGTPFGFFILPPNKNTLYLLNVTSSKPKEFTGNFGRFKELDNSNVKLTFDDRRGYLYIHSTELKSQKSVVTVFDVINERFWEYNGLLVSRWANDQDNIYYITNNASKIVEAFKNDVYTDNGVNINFDIETADTYSKSLSFLKFASRLFANVEYWGDFVFNFKLLDQRKAKGTGGLEVYEKTFDLKMNSSPMTTMLPYFGLGVFGCCGFNFTEDVFSEYFDIDQLINKTYFRGIAKISGSANIRFRIRGIGILFGPTMKPFGPTVLS